MLVGASIDKENVYVHNPAHSKERRGPVTLDKIDGVRPGRSVLRLSEISQGQKAKQLMFSFIHKS